MKRSMGSTNLTKKGNKISNDDQDSSSVNGLTEPSVSFSSNNSNILYSERPLSSQSSLSVKSEPEPLTATRYVKKIYVCFLASPLKGETFDLFFYGV